MMYLQCARKLMQVPMEKVSTDGMREREREARLSIGITANVDNWKNE